MEELREKIAKLIPSYYIYPHDWQYIVTDKIITIIKEAGYKSPEEVRQFTLNMCDTCLPEPGEAT